MSRTRGSDASRGAHRARDNAGNRAADRDADRVEKTPLFDEHVRLNAKIVPFGGFAMPVQYPSGIRREHAAVREQVGLFDVSHMGEFRVSGANATELVSRATTNDPSGLAVGEAQYSVMCFPSGGIVDDLLVYRLADDTYRLVVNAANRQKDWEHLIEVRAEFDAELEDESDRIALLALQGPRAQDRLAPLTGADLDGIAFYAFAEADVAGVPGIVSRTGYTGEDGFELYLPADGAVQVWRRLLEPEGGIEVVPAGLGARDTLRLEMGYALYGNDIDDETTPLEAGLGWLVKLDKGDFVGRSALVEQKEEGLECRLTGFRLTARGFPRAGYDVLYGEWAAPVRSGTMSPTLGYGIGTVYLPSSARPEEPVRVRIRGEEIEGEVIRMPFYTGGSLRR